MATMLETPSRIWRRIEAVQDKEMPSLPSLPGFDEEDLEDLEERTPSRVIQDDSDDTSNDSLGDLSTPITSTPTMSNHTHTATMHAPPSAGSTARFAHSIASRSSRSSKSSIGPTTMKGQKDSFDVTDIPSFSVHPRENTFSKHFNQDKSSFGDPGVFLPPLDDDVASEDDFSISDALQSVSRSKTPPLSAGFQNKTPKSAQAISVSATSEPKASPFDKYRNVALRKTLARTRTPSLSRTTSSSQTTSPSASTPKSTRSLNLAYSDAGSDGVVNPRSASISPAQQTTARRVEVNQDPDRSQETSDTGGSGSMDITDIHISPQRVDENGNVYTDTEGENEQEEDDDAESVTNQNGRRQYSEPTFSSEGDPPSSAFSSRTVMPLTMPTVGTAASSAAPSFAMTPTPAFPRPRARFDLPKPPAELFQTPAPQTGHDEDDDLVTPHTRRKSFLLSVINSNARPRMKLGTPHPRQHALDTPSISEVDESAVEETPRPAAVSLPPVAPAPVPSIASRLPFNGLTPRPRQPVNRRMSHPLAQAIVPSPTNSADTPSQASGSTSASQSQSMSRPSSRISPPSFQAKPWSTPAQVQSSPMYDGAMDKASFISTASSHDLTTHHRVNTSFDPAMGFGAAAQGHGVGRFNAGKLNNYLHGLNRRLQEENENLLARVRRLEEERKGEMLGEGNGSGISLSTSSRRSSGVQRRLSAASGGAGGLDNVEEEAWVEEKAQLEEMVEVYKVEAEELEKDLEQEREERKRDKDRWEERMAEAEQGVVKIIGDLEKKVANAEERAKVAAGNERTNLRLREEAERDRKEAERALDDVRGELDIANGRAEKAERLLESGKDLGGALHEANEHVARVMTDLRNANAQIKDLEEEVIRSDHRVDELEKDLREDKDIIAHLEEELAAQSEEIDAEKAKVSDLQVKMQNLEEEIASCKEYINELEEGAADALEHIEKLEREVEEGGATSEAVHLAEERAAQTIEDLERDVQRGRDTLAQTQEALDEAKKKLEDDEDEVSELRRQVASLERERDKLYKLVDAAESSDPSFTKSAQPGPTEEELQKVEAELDDANQEIGRLNALLNRSPARKAMDKAKDARIEMLEEEREELLERNKALRMACEATTPRKVANSSMISPIHRHVLSMSIRAPRTPGAPLKDMSWLNNTTNDPTVTPLIAEIQRLQAELDIANESIDDKLDKLEDAGLGVVGLTEKLEDARAKVSRLEDEIGRLARKEERLSKRLARSRCKKCNVKLDFLQKHIAADESCLSYDASGLELGAEPPTPPSKTTEVLKAQLQAANASLEKLRGDMEDLQASNKRLNSKIRETKEESKKAMESNRAKSNVQSELEKAKRTIADLEFSLKEERAKMRGIALEQERTEKDKKKVLSDLRRAESDMDDVRQRLQQLKQENQEMEKELRQNSTAERKVKHLEIKVSENYETISQLRQERSMISKDHKDLQRRYSELSETVSNLREKHAAHSTSHDNWRHKLDLQVLEIDELKQALADRSTHLHIVQKEKEKLSDKLSSANTDIAQNVSHLEADLRRVRRDAEAFGRDLEVLRREKATLEDRLKDEKERGDRGRKQMEARVKILDTEVERARGRAARVLEEWEGHVCVGAGDAKQVAELKIQHNKECKGLIVQIRYLKAKFIRESTFREDLTWQKEYLLVLLGQFKHSERTIFASIAHIGFPVEPPRQRKRTLRSVVLGVMFVSRVKRGSEKWQQERTSRETVTAALEYMQRKKLMASASSASS